MGEESTAGYLAGRIDALREHAIALAAAVPGLPAAFGRVQDQLAQEWQARPPGTVFGLILGFILLGYALEIVYRYSFRGGEARDESVRERVRSIGMRLAREIGGVAAFTVGSVAAFLAFDWPARTREAVIAALAAFIVVRVVLLASRTLLSPREARLRLLPASDGEARFWQLRVALLTSWYAFGWVLFGWLALLGMDLPSRQVIAYLMGLVLLAIAVEAFWRRSRLAAAYFSLLWVLWAMKATGALWLAIVVAALPDVLRLAQRGVDHALRPPSLEAPEARGVLAAALGRGLRALAIIGAAFLLIHAFQLDVDSLAAAAGFWPRLLRGAVQALAIVLIADVIWMVCAALIDQKLAAVKDSDNARLRTLLPIVRGSIAVVLLVMTVLMAVSALGIEVGPLLASAGVIGIAVGFGAQTLVRDLFSKFFYLLDDAFRVGEYIESGNYKGTVEHLGARSIRLRHHRGPVFTIPYGQLGAVKNSSRDWVIDKMQLGVTYDTDLDKAKKLIKKIGLQLAEDPEFKDKILEPLKMQGVEQFGDFAIQIRIKMMTKPNEQFSIRRRAYAMIKKAFAENGIHFAYPTVQVAGAPADAATAAAAAIARENLKAS